MGGYVFAFQVACFLNSPVLASNNCHIIIRRANCSNNAEVSPLKAAEDNRRLCWCRQVDLSSKHAIQGKFSSGIVFNSYINSLFGKESLILCDHHNAQQWTPLNPDCYWSPDICKSLCCGD